MTEQFSGSELMVIGDWRISEEDEEEENFHQIHGSENRRIHRTINRRIDGYMDDGISKMTFVV